MPRGASEGIVEYFRNLEPESWQRTWKPGRIWLMGVFNGLALGSPDSSEVLGKVNTPNRVFIKLSFTILW